MDKYGLDIQLKKQQAQRPEFNVFDYGIFCSMQKMVTAAVPPTLDALIDVVDEVWKNYPHHLINDVFLSLFNAQQEIVLLCLGRFEKTWYASSLNYCSLSFVC